MNVRTDNILIPSFTACEVRKGYQSNQRGVDNTFVTIHLSADASIFLKRYEKYILNFKVLGIFLDFF